MLVSWLLPSVSACPSKRIVFMSLLSSSSSINRTAVLFAAVFAEALFCAYSMLTFPKLLFVILYFAVPPDIPELSQNEGIRR